MTKELKVFRKICKNLNGYEFTDEFKKNKELIEQELKKTWKLEKAITLLKEFCFSHDIEFTEWWWSLPAEEYDLLRELFSLDLVVINKR